MSTHYKIEQQISKLTQELKSSKTHIKKAYLEEKIIILNQFLLTKINNVRKSKPH